MKSARLRSDRSATPGELAFIDPKFDELRSIRADPYWRADAYWMDCRVRLEAGGNVVEAKLSMIEPYRDDTIAFFRELSARDDRWSGTARWYSEHGELDLGAEADGSGSLRMRVALREYAHLDPIQVAELVVSPADLRSFTEALADLFRVRPTAPRSTRPRLLAAGQ